MTIKVAAISDTHGLHRQLEIEPCDILLHAGDVSSLGQKYEMMDFFDWLEEQPAVEKCWIAGNHDVTLQEKPAWLRRALLARSKNIHYLEDSGVEIMGIKIWGTPWQPEFFNWAFNLPRGPELAKKYALMPEDTDILISHGPPYGIEDSVPEKFRQPGQTDLHVGCKDLLHHIQKGHKRLCYNIFGHIHIDGRKEIEPVEEGAVDCINAAVVDNRYDVIVKPYYFNYEI